MLRASKVTDNAMEIADPKERLAALNELLIGLHFSHNEARRVTKAMLMTVTEILCPAPVEAEADTPKPAPAKAKGKKQEEPKDA